jgi:hypothetical protein
VKEVTIMHAKHLVLATIGALALPASFAAWSDQAQSGAYESPGRETGPVGRGGIASDVTSDSESGLAINPEDYLHRDAVNTKGDKVGEVDMLVVNRTGSIEAVIDVGGFLGIGEQKIVVPIAQLQPKDGKVVVNTTLTEEQLKRATPYRHSDFSPFGAEKREQQAPDRPENQ